MPPSATATFPTVSRTAPLDPPCDVPEELALQELGGKTWAVEGDQRTGGALAAGMDRPGQDFLAGPAFAAKQDGCLAGRGLEGHIQDLAHRRLARLQFHLGHDPMHLFLRLAGLGHGIVAKSGFDDLLSGGFKRRFVNHESVHGRCLMLLNLTRAFCKVYLAICDAKGPCRLSDILHKSCHLNQLWFVADLRHAGCWKGSADTMPLRVGPPAKMGDQDLDGSTTQHLGSEDQSCVHIRGIS